MSLTKEQASFLESAKALEAAKKTLEEASANVEADMLVLGFGTYVQDPDDGTVYKIVKPNGRFVHFKDIEYVRTAQEGERANTLSKKEAEGAGFILRK